MKAAKLLAKAMLLGTLVLGMFSCSNLGGSGGTGGGDGSVPNGKGRLVVSVGNANARTILAEDVDKENGGMKYVLTGTKTDGTLTDKEIGSWENYSAMHTASENGTIVADVGTWNFTLTASLNDILLYSGKVENKEIKYGMDPDNSLSFTLTEVEDALTATDGKGNFKLKLTIPSNSGIETVKACLISFDNYPADDGDFVDEPTVDNSGSELVIEYSKTAHKPGIYVVQFKFLKTGGEEVKPGYREVVQIKNGRVSEAERSIANIETFYTITYNNAKELTTPPNNVIFYSAPLVFNKNDEVTLPTDKDIYRFGYSFDGWFDNEEFTGDRVTKILRTNANSDKELWAKWTPNVITMTVTITETDKDIEGEVLGDLSGKKILLTAPEGYAAYTWYIDDEKASELGSDKKVVVSENTLTMENASLFGIGTHSVFVTITDNDNKKYSKGYVFKIKETWS